MQLFNTMIVTAVSAASSIVTVLIVKILLRPEKIREKSEALKTFRMQREAALRLKDHKLLKKLNKQKLYMSQIEKEVSSFQMKMAIINMLPLGVFTVLSFFIPLTETAGYLSASVSQGGGPISIPLAIWYSICMVFFMLLFRRLMGAGL